MAVHASSVISTWINTFDPDLYTALTSQENDAYTRGGVNTVANWSPLFTNLNSALTNWKNTSRQSLISSLILPLYSYRITSVIFGTSSSVIDSGAVDANNIFNMNGLIATIKARPNNYYNDLVIVTSPPSISSAKISSDISAINSSLSVESSSVNMSISSMNSSIQSNLMNQLFVDPVISGSSPSKADMANFIFNTLHFKRIYQNLNVGSLTIPSTVT